MTHVKRKCGRPPKHKTKPDTTLMPAANTSTVQTKPVHKDYNTEIISRDLIQHINKEREKSDRSTIARLDSVVKANKQNYKSNLLTEKYSLLPSQSYQSTPAQTALQQLLEKHPDFEIQPINTIRPPEIEYTQTSQALVPTYTPLSIIRKHIP